MTQYLPIMKTKETLTSLNIFLVLSSASILAPCYSMCKLSLPPRTSNISCNLTHALLKPYSRVIVRDSVAMIVTKLPNIWKFYVSLLCHHMAQKSIIINISTSGKSLKQKKTQGPDF